MQISRLALLPSLLVGCAPHDAEVSGSWFVWLAANSSASVAEDAIEDIRDKATIFDCKRGWDSRANDWEDGYIGPRESDDPADPKFYGGACSPDDSGCDGTTAQDELEAECDNIDALSFYTFLQEDGFYGLTGEFGEGGGTSSTGAEIEPAWRTEALLNGEGDLQLTTHLRLGNGQDFRFAFSIDPDFKPVDCVTDDAGNPAIEYVDGADWLSEWSADEEGYSIYYLNAGLAQQNPSDDDVYWFLTSDWSAGYGHAKFASEEFSSDPGYAEVAISTADREDPEAAMAVYEQSAIDFETVSTAWAEELTTIAGANHGEGQPAFSHKIEDNLWRPLDSSNNGYDGWLELHPSWVRVKNGSSMEKGGTVEGDYQIYFIGLESGSTLLVTGTFKIDKLRVDPWAYPYLEDDKRAENGTEYCGGAAMP